MRQEARGVLWQFLFLLRTFFGACRAHNFLNNHKNQYCIECDKAACQHCLAEGTHVNHRVITIYRLVYRDVVSLDEMSRHMNCSRIQPYLSNGKQVIALSPLPHHGSGSLKRNIACHFCARRLMDPSRYRFCSIACKLGVNTGKPTTKPKPVRTAPDNCRDPDDNVSNSVDTDTDIDTDTDGVARQYARRLALGRGAGRRKGIPMRAPFF